MKLEFGVFLTGQHRPSQCVGTTEHAERDRQWDEVPIKHEIYSPRPRSKKHPYQSRSCV